MTRLHHKSRSNEQLFFAFGGPRCFVVPNHWGPVYHLCDENDYSYFEDEPPSFASISDAMAFARARGVEAEVPERTKERWNRRMP